MSKSYVVICGRHDTWSRFHDAYDDPVEAMRYAKRCGEISPATSYAVVERSPWGGISAGLDQFGVPVNTADLHVYGAPADNLLRAAIGKSFKMGL